MDCEVTILSRVKSALFAGALLWLTFALTARAQEDVLFLEPSAAFTFGQELRFGLAAENAQGVESITLFLQPERSLNVYEINVPFEPDERIDVLVTVPVEKTDLRPFHSLNYGWELQTANGIQRVPPQVLNYRDDRFNWQQLTEEGITALWTSEGPFFGEQVVEIAAEALRTGSTLLPLAQIEPIDIYVYPSSADVRTAVDLVGAAEDAAVLPGAGVLLLAVVNPQSATDELLQSVPPAVGELLLFQAAHGDLGVYPWWFRQGLLQMFGTAGDVREQELLAQAVADGSTAPLWRLCVDPQESGDTAVVTAAQSGAILDYVARTRGETAVRDLAAAYIAGDDCETGTLKALGLSLDELQRAWLADRLPRSAVGQFWTDNGLWLVLLLGGTLIAALVYWVTYHGDRKT